MTRVIRPYSCYRLGSGVAREGYLWENGSFCYCSDADRSSIFVVVYAV